MEIKGFFAHPSVFVSCNDWTDVKVLNRARCLSVCCFFAVIGANVKVARSENFDLSHLWAVSKRERIRGSLSVKSSLCSSLFFFFRGIGKKKIGTMVKVASLEILNPSHLQVVCNRKYRYE